MTRDRLIASYKAGRRDFRGLHLCTMDLRGCDLSGSDLSGSDLSGSDLECATLTGVDFSGADLSFVNLTGADLSFSNLTGITLRFSNLSGADLTGVTLQGVNMVKTDLSGALLTLDAAADIRGRDPACGFSLSTVPVVPNIDAAILAAINDGGGLNMDTWHMCNTTHCRAGWAVHLAGTAGAIFERALGTSAAAALIYVASRPGRRVPDWYATADEALADIRACAAMGAA